MGKKIVIHREYKAPLEMVWAKWTTKDGIESWWGPGGFRVEVLKLDLRPGGELLYRMIAVGKEQIAFMKREGMPTSQDVKIVYREVQAPTRLRYINLVDFVPAVKAYDVETDLKLESKGALTLLTLSLDPMHDQEWTQRASMGWESELDKLIQALK